MIKKITFSLITVLLITPFVFAADCETVYPLHNFLAFENGDEWNYNNGIVWIGRPTGNCVTTSEGEACEFQIDDLIYGIVKYYNEGSTPANTDSTIWLNAFGRDSLGCFKNFEEHPDAAGYLFASTYETKGYASLRLGSCASSDLAEFNDGYYLRDCTESYFPIVNDSIYGLVGFYGPPVYPNIEFAYNQSITDVVESISQYINYCNHRLDIFEECKVEDCELYFRYGVYNYENYSGAYAYGYTIDGPFGNFWSYGLEEDPSIPFLYYTPWIANSEMAYYPVIGSDLVYYDALYFDVIFGSSCKVSYSAMDIETCVDDAMKSTDTLYFEVDQNTMVELDLTPLNNSCIDDCLLDYSVDKLGLLTKGEGCFINYTPGNDFCGEEHLTFYYINDEGEVISQCAVINVVCDPVEFEVYVESMCDTQTGNVEPYFFALNLDEAQVIQWRLCDSNEWTALNFEEIGNTEAGIAWTASPGFIWGHIEAPFCLQYRDPENPNAIVTWTGDACTYLPGSIDENIIVEEEFICNFGAEQVTTILTLTPKSNRFGNIYWEHCECRETQDDPNCQEWNLASEIGGGAVMIEVPTHSFSENLCIKIFDSNTEFQGVWKHYGPVDRICQKPLAIELLNFEGHKMDNTNELVWNVATEKNNDYYILEKSKDGIHFSELAKIKSQGSRNQLMTYDYKDSNPDHINYYRLISVDEMGNEEIVSDVIRIEQDKLVDLTVFPNPTKGQFEIEYKSDAAQNIQVEVFDVAGKLIITERLKTSVGTNNYPLNINQYPNGTYFVKIINDSAIFVRKVLKN